MLSRKGTSPPYKLSGDPTPYLIYSGRNVAGFDDPVGFPGTQFPPRTRRIKHAVWLGGRCGMVRYVVCLTCSYLHWVRSGGAPGGDARKSCSRCRRRTCCGPCCADATVALIGPPTRVAVHRTGEPAAAQGRRHWAAGDRAHPRRALPPNLTLALLLP